GICGELAGIGDAGPGATARQLFRALAAGRGSSALQPPSPEHRNPECHHAIRRPSAHPLRTCLGASDAAAEFLAEGHRLITEGRGFPVRKFLALILTPLALLAGCGGSGTSHGGPPPPPPPPPSQT